MRVKRWISFASCDRVRNPEEEKKIFSSYLTDGSSLTATRDPKNRLDSLRARLPHCNGYLIDADASLV